MLDVYKNIMNYREGYFFLIKFFYKIYSCNFWGKKRKEKYRNNKDKKDKFLNVNVLIIRIKYKEL